jgi:hypothetical protein
VSRVTATRGRRFDARGYVDPRGCFCLTFSDGTATPYEWAYEDPQNGPSIDSRVPMGCFRTKREAVKVLREWLDK